MFCPLRLRAAGGMGCDGMGRDGMMRMGWDGMMGMGAQQCTAPGTGRGGTMGAVELGWCPNSGLTLCGQGHRASLMLYSARSQRAGNPLK